MTDNIRQELDDFLLNVAEGWGYLFNNYYDELLHALKLRQLLKDKINWCSTWKDTNTENGRAYKLLEELYNESEKYYGA